MLIGVGTPSTTGTYQELMRLLRQSQRFERHPRARARLNDKVHLLDKVTLSRWREVAVLLSAQKQIQRIKQNEEKRNMF